MRSVFVAIIVFLAVRCSAATYYVSFSTGNDSYAGTSLNLPFKTITKAVSVSTAGDIIYLRGENHAYANKISISKSGTASARISLLAYPGDASRPVLNFSTQTTTGTRGLELSGNYWYIKGIDFYKSQDNGMHLSGANNIIEFCNFYENGDTGLQLANGANNNQIINCDSYYNIDASEGNADGFAAKLDVGTGNSFKGCRAWQNSDDGWDGLLSTGYTAVITTTYDSCWCFLNGYRKDKSVSLGNGNGFKMGGNNTIHNAILRNCVSVYNRVKGFDQNNNNGSMTLYNCTGFKNKPNFGMNNNDPSPGYTMTIKNCISFQSQSTDVFRTVAVRSNNSWQGFNVTTADFVSLDTSLLRAPRKADGSLPDIAFMNLAAGSSLIDAGTNVGLGFKGTAPDIGAFESNFSLPVNFIAFAATVKENDVQLSWSTATESNNAGFDVQRKLNGSDWQTIGFVKGAGTSSSVNNYRYTDKNVTANAVIQYRLKQTDFDGVFKYSNTVTVRVNEKAAQLSIYPNPVETRATVKYNLTEKGSVQLHVLSASGQLIKTLVNESADAGSFTRAIDLTSLASGNYVLVLLANNLKTYQSFIKVK